MNKIKVFKVGDIVEYRVDSYATILDIKSIKMFNKKHIFYTIQILNSPLKLTFSKKTALKVLGYEK
jgi:hypothetical protein